MPTLPRPSPSLRRPIARPSAMPPANEPSDPDILESAGLRWINVTRPRLADQEWLDARFGFHPLDFEDVYSRNQRPKLDAYDDYLFIVLHFPVFDPAAARLNTAELDLFVGPDYLVSLPNDPIPPLEAMFVRFSEREDLREQTFSKGSGYLLYKLVDACVDASFPMLRKIGLRLERIEDDIFEGRSPQVVREISNVKQEIINFRKVIRPQRAALRDLERTKQRYIADDLDIYFEDIVDASEQLRSREPIGRRKLRFPVAPIGNSPDAVLDQVPGRPHQVQNQVPDRIGAGIWLGPDLILRKLGEAGLNFVRVLLRQIVAEQLESDGVERERRG